MECSNSREQVEQVEGQSETVDGEKKGDPERRLTGEPAKRKPIYIVMMV